MKEKEIITILVNELKFFDKKKAGILQDSEKLSKKSKLDPSEIKPLVRRAKNLAKDLTEKLENLEKMASKI